MMWVYLTEFDRHVILWQWWLYFASYMRVFCQILIFGRGVLLVFGTFRSIDGEGYIRNFCLHLLVCHKVPYWESYNKRLNIKFIKSKKKKDNKIELIARRTKIFWLSYNKFGLVSVDLAQVLNKIKNLFSPIH
jgi:hypothetical protein